MNFFRTKHPKKKRRIDEEPTPGPSSAFFPLVTPRPKFHQDVVSASSSSDEEEPSALSEKGTLHTNIFSTSHSKRRVKNRKHKANVPIKFNKFFKPSDSSESTNRSESTNHSESTIRKTDPVSTREYIKRSVPKLMDQSTVQKFMWKKNWDKKDEELLDSITENERFFKLKDCYGLVENSVPEEMDGDYFKNLPTHIIESIFCQIPIIDLMSCRTVCSRWLHIIDNYKFMEWKKLYYRYKNESRNVVTYELVIQALLDRLGYKTAEDCISTIIKYMGKYFHRIPCSEMYSLLIQNPHGELADHVLSERFPEWNAKESRIWCQFAMAVIICETVWDILEVYKSLFTSKCSCIRPDVHDAMYCIATFLLHFRLIAKINCGLHYRVYYALYLIENNVPFCQREKINVRLTPGQQSLCNYSKENTCLTYEQLRVLNHTFDMNQKIKITALAGTGKTTTLVYLARLYPQVKFLYLVVNKSVCEEAKKMFPPNVTCRTAHALAYNEVGKRYREKLTSTLQAQDLMRYFVYNEEHINGYAYASLVISTINKFAKSNSTSMSDSHVPYVDTKQNTLSEANRSRIFKDAHRIWRKMIEVDSGLKVTHDVYLKLYHLRRPKLNRIQCIMLDEIEDCHPVILDLVLSQSVPVLFVGDPHQQMYGFRGVLREVKTTHTYHLTKSFRFGPQISYIASCILEILLHIKSTTLVGDTSDSNLCGDTSGQFAIIARSNNVLFNEALRMIVFKRLKPYEPTVIKAAFAGGIDTYGFDQILDIYKLKFIGMEERDVKDKLIRNFRSYTDFVRYARNTDDRDLLSKIEIVNEYGRDLSKFIAILSEKCSSPIELANVVFSTVHKSKGFEFDTVSLTDDYAISTVPGFLNFETSLNEANLLYLAVTRAKKCLLLPEKMAKVLHLAHEKFEYPVSSRALLKSNPEQKCVICNTSFIPHTVLMSLRRKCLMASGREIPEGPLCMKCRTDPYMRPDVHMNNLVMYLDPTRDNSHRFMSSIVGPLPDDPPIVHDNFSEFRQADNVFVINLNMY